MTVDVLARTMEKSFPSLEFQDISASLMPAAKGREFVRKMVVSVIEVMDFATAKMIYILIYISQSPYLVIMSKQGAPMSQVAKVFTNGRSQAVRLPAAFRFDTKEVFIRQDTETGDVILSRKPADWDSFFSLVDKAAAPADFLDHGERQQPAQERDPFEGWTE